MLKKSVITSIALVTMVSSSIIQAGAYLGIAAGANQGRWNITDSAGNNVKFGRSSAMGSIFAGYGSMLNANLYLGGETLASLANTGGPYQTFMTPGGAMPASIKQTYSYGLSILPGVVVGQGTMLYFRGGMVRSHFQVRAGNTTYNQTLNLNGKQLGVGIERAYTSNVDVRLEYAYTRFNSVSSLGSSFSPRNNQLMLGLLYKSG